jgi:hypothetical protein
MHRAEGPGQHPARRAIRKDSFAICQWPYGQRDPIERFFNRINQFRGLVTRYDRSPDNFLAALTLIVVSIWISAICARSLDDTGRRLRRRGSARAVALPDGGAVFRPFGPTGKAVRLGDVENAPQTVGVRRAA